MKADIIKYQHYLLILLALLLANYLLVPLSELQSEQQETLRLLQNKQHKTKTLIDVGISSDENKQLSRYLKNSHDYLFVQKNEAEFKQIVHAKLEELLNSADCNVSRIGFKGNQNVLPKIQKWHMEIRYKGDADCLVKTTRAIETVKPYINIENYSYSARDFDKTARSEFNASLNVSVWYKQTDLNSSNVGKEEG